MIEVIHNNDNLAPIFWNHYYNHSSSDEHIMAMVIRRKKSYNQYSSHSFDGSSWWNARRPKYTKPCQAHERAKTRLSNLLDFQGYGVIEEYVIDLRDGGCGYRGRKDIPFRIDLYAEHPKLDDKLLIQIDGEYHRQGKNIGKTKNRNEAQQSYAEVNGMRYITMTTEEANQLPDSDLHDKLNIGWIECGKNC